MPSPKIHSTKGVTGGGSEPAVPADATRRSVPEWRGRTPDTPIPPHVKVRIFEAHGGRCYLSGRKIMAADAYDFDHKIALCNGGENRESNIGPALRDKHKEKTRADVDEKSKTYRMKAKDLGLWPKGQKIPSRPFSYARKA